MIQKFWLIASFSLLTLYPSYILANQTVTGLELEYRLRQDGNAHYNVMWEKLMALGFRHPLNILPLKRAFRDFSEENQSCIFPSHLESLTGAFPQFKKSDLLASDGIDYATLKVMTRQGEPVITNLKQLEGKTVALWNGLDPNIYLKGVNAKVETTTDEAVRLKMLYSYRVDAMLGFLPDTLIAADALGIEPPVYDEDFEFYKKQAVGIVCFNSPQNRALINSFNQHLKTLKDSGELKRILGPYANVK